MISYIIYIGSPPPFKCKFLQPGNIAFPFYRKEIIQRQSWEEAFPLPLRMFAFIAADLCFPLPCWKRWFRLRIFSPCFLNAGCCKSSLTAAPLCKHLDANICDLPHAHVVAPWLGVIKALQNAFWHPLSKWCQISALSHGCSILPMSHWWK